MANSGEEVWEKAGTGMGMLAEYVKSAKVDEGPFIWGVG